MTMIEKVARAICAADGLDWDAQANAMTSGGGSDDEQEGYFDKARAAIEAMREPTSDMLNATGLRTGVTLSIWWSMIDTAALKRTGTENP